MKVAIDDPDARELRPYGRRELASALVGESLFLRRLARKGVHDDMAETCSARRLFQRNQPIDG